MTQMLYQGHGSYRLTADDGTTVYVDPYAGEGYDAPADLILVTHEHFDHTQVRRMPHAKGCEIIRAADAHPFPDEYKTLESHGIRVTAVQACNENHPVDECVGFVIEIDDVSFYASGDTSTTEDMESGKLEAMGLDYAVLPADGVFNMDVKEASKCAKLIGAKHTIPVHLMPVRGQHDAKNAASIFSEEKAEAFKAKGKIVLRPGETLDL